MQHKKRGCFWALVPVVILLGVFWYFQTYFPPIQKAPLVTRGNDEWTVVYSKVTRRDFIVPNQNNLNFTSVVEADGQILLTRRDPSNYAELDMQVFTLDRLPEFKVEVEVGTTGVACVLVDTHTHPADGVGMAICAGDGEVTIQKGQELDPTNPATIKAATVGRHKTNSSKNRLIIIKEEHKLAVFLETQQGEGYAMDVNWPDGSFGFFSETLNKVSHFSDLKISVPTNSRNTGLQHIPAAYCSGMLHFSCTSWQYAAAFNGCILGVIRPVCS